MSLIASRAALFGEGVMDQHVEIAAIGGYAHRRDSIGIG